jgi:hypothetical protein
MKQRATSKITNPSIIICAAALQVRREQGLQSQFALERLILHLQPCVNE